MSAIVIPAQFGFYAVWTKPSGEVCREPIIAWVIDPQNLFEPPTPLGVHGACDDSAQIVDPNGRIIAS